MIETDVAKLEMDPRGFLKITLLDSLKAFDASEAERQIAAGDTLTNGNKYPVLVVVKDSSVTPSLEAKKLISKVENRLKEAIVVSSLGQRMTANLYFKLSKRNTHPRRMFKDENEAIQWLITKN